MHAWLLAVVLAIDPARSTSAFSVQHIFVEHVTGTVPIVSGSIEIPDGATIPTRIDAVLDPKRFKTDEPDRDAALQGPDWFDTKQFPTWTFVSTSIVPSAKGFVANGSLTIHGVSQPEELDVVVAGTPAHPIYRATAHVNRHAFGMAITRLDPVIGEVVDITFDIQVKQ